MILSAVENIPYLLTSDEYDLYFFTEANRGCFDNLELNFWIAQFLSDIKLRMYARQIKQFTSQFDVIC